MARINTKTSGSARNLPGLIAQGLGAAGDNLGLDVKVVDVREVEPRIQPPKVSRAQIEQFANSGVGMAALATAANAKAEGRPFAGTYGPQGFWVSSERGRAAEQEAEARAASPADLQMVLRANASNIQRLTNNELGLRFDQYVKNNPEVQQRINDPLSGKSIAEASELERREFGKMHFDKQRSMSMRDGILVMLPNHDQRQLSSLRRGYKVIESELETRGLVPEVTMMNQERQKREVASANRVADANHQVAAPRKLMRGGMEL